MAKRWYVVHTYSGYENKVKSDLEHRVQTLGYEDLIVDIKIPTEEVTEVKVGGKRETKENKVFPAYVLVRMEMDENTWSVVRNIPGVTGFVGPDNKPTPLSREEFNKIMRRTQPSKVTTATKRVSTDLEVGQTIRVVSGALADFEGVISEVMAEVGKIKVKLVIFGRETPVELSIDQVATVN